MNARAKPADPRDAQIESLRLPPHSIEAERAVLGGLLLRNDAWDRIGDVLTEAAFYRMDHRVLWSTITRLVEDNRPADILTVHAELKRLGKGEEFSLAHLDALVTETPTVANIRRYAEIVRDHALRRQLVAAGTRIADEAFASRDEVATLCDRAQADIASATQATARKGEAPRMSVLLGDVMSRLDELHKNPRMVTGLPTGFVDLDEMTAGLQGGDLVLIAGRPSMGKTALAMNITEYAAVEEKKPVVVFSMEMAGVQLATRMLGSLAKVDSQRLRTGKLEQNDWDRMGRALGSLNEAPIRIDESPALTVMDVRARARRFSREYGGLGLIVIDYVQLMAGDGRSDNRNGELTVISSGLKAMAKELSVPVILLSQLSRAVESRSNKRPMMPDLRDSGSLEQDADMILFIYRDEVYDDESPDRGIAEIIIAKQRNGPIGTVKLTFLGKHTRFENYAGMPGYSEPRQPRTPKKPARTPLTEKD